MPTDIGTGTVMVFATSSFAPEITSISWSGVSRESINISHMGTTGAHLFVPGDLHDPGELSVDMHFDPSAAPAVPWSAAAETITITFPAVGTLSTSAWSASGFMTDFEFTDPMEDKMTASATLKFSDTIAKTAAS